MRLFVIILQPLVIIIIIIIIIIIVRVFWLVWYFHDNAAEALYIKKPYSSFIRSSIFCERIINVWDSLPADADFSSANTVKNGIVLILPSYLDGVCNLCVHFFRAAVTCKGF